MGSRQYPLNYRNATSLCPSTTVFRVPLKLHASLRSCLLVSHYTPRVNQVSWTRRRTCPMHSDGGGDCTVVQSGHHILCEHRYALPHPVVFAYSLPALPVILMHIAFGSTHNLCVCVCVSHLIVHEVGHTTSHTVARTNTTTTTTTTATISADCISHNLTLTLWCKVLCLKACNLPPIDSSLHPTDRTHPTIVHHLLHALHLSIQVPSIHPHPHSPHPPNRHFLQGNLLHLPLTMNYHQSHVVASFSAVRITTPPAVSELRPTWR